MHPLLLDRRKNDQKYLLDCALTHSPLLERGPGSGPDHGHTHDQDHSKISAVFLRAVVETEERAQIGPGTAGYTDAAQRSAVAHRIYQQSGGTHRQQALRMRDDSVIPK